MSDPGLDSDEFDVLIEALEAWVNKEAAGEMVAELVTAVLPDGKGEAKTAMEDIRAKNRKDRSLRKERAILIQAKLIQMRDQFVAEGIIEETRPTGG